MSGPTNRHLTIVTPHKTCTPLDISNGVEYHSHIDFRLCSIPAVQVNGCCTPMQLSDLLLWRLKVYVRSEKDILSNLMHHSAFPSKLWGYEVSTLVKMVQRSIVANGIGLVSSQPALAMAILGAMLDKLPKCLGFYSTIPTKCHPYTHKRSVRSSCKFQSSWHS